MAILPVLILFVCSVLADWRQDCGDPLSSSYIGAVPSSGVLNVTGEWNYTDPSKYSIFYQAAAVSEEGVVFLPFLEHVQYLLQVRAIAPNGSLLWIVDDIVGYDEFHCAVVLLTNAVYSGERKMVVIGWTCAAAFPYYKKHGGLVAINSQTGERMWRSPNLTDANDLSKISLSSNVAYTSGGFDCWKDVSLQGRLMNPRFVHHVGNSRNNTAGQSQIFAISLNDGSVLWTKNHTGVGCSSQTKLYPLQNGRHIVIIPSELPKNIYLGGKLLALECDAAGSCTEKWLSDIGVCYASTYGFSNQGVLFGGTGFDGDPNTIFGLNISTGKRVFNSVGYCKPGSYPGGPAVDKLGHAYYSCGNRVFAIYSNGTLIWKTDILKDSPGYKFSTQLRFSPAVVSSTNYSTDILIVADSNSSFIFALSSSNGTVIGSYKLPVLVNDNGNVGMPPFVISNRVYWIRAHYVYSKYYLYSIPIEYLLNKKVSFSYDFTA